MCPHTFGQMAGIQSLLRSRFCFFIFIFYISSYRRANGRDPVSPPLATLLDPLACDFARDWQRLLRQYLYSCTSKASILY